MVVLRVTCPVQLLILFMTLFGILMIRLSFCLVLVCLMLFYSVKGGIIYRKRIMATLSLHQLYGSRPVILHKVMYNQWTSGIIYQSQLFLP
ncbi:hypothetical protein BC941DRAFT_519423 [Chlamydoabsidia padenii]|nr:hypothetical protein BC941DRAFT_519423 [Chlamydoabsidia padenii]